MRTLACTIFASLALAVSTKAADEVLRVFPLRFESTPQAISEIPQDSTTKVRALLNEAGVTFDVNNTSKYFYNDRTLTLHVRATLRDLLSIERAIHAKEPPAHILLDVKFVEGGEHLLKQLNLPVLPTPFTGQLTAQAAAEKTVAFQARVLTTKQASDTIANLEKAPGTDTLTPPRVSTLSGRQARIAIENQEVITIPPFRAPGPNAREILRANAE